MELDKTTIVLRQRPLADLIDLSLIVMKVYWKSLLVYAAIGVVPFLILNYVILRPLTDYDAMLVFKYFAFEELPFRIRYIAFLAGFIYLQTPIAMLGVTYYLGHTLFMQPTSYRELGKTLVKMLAGLIYVLGFLRFGLLVWLTVVLMPNKIEFNPAVEVFWLGFVLCGSAIVVRAVRPFAPEILLLEQSPLRRTGHPQAGQSIPFQERSRTLHTDLSGDLLMRSITMCITILMTLTAITLGELFVSGVFFGVWTWEWWMDTILFPLNLWLVGLWGTVFRFLSYLDCRTRLEGWELDLRLRAEAKRLTGATVR